MAGAGGPKFLVEHGKTGYVANHSGEFTEAILELCGDEDRRLEMRRFARKAAQRFSWDRVFEEVHRNYDACDPLNSSSTVTSIAETRSPAVIQS